MAKKQEQKTIDKQKRLKEINERLSICDAYLKMELDPTVKSRVDALAKNPCLSGMFYLNAIYKTSFRCSEEEAKENAKKCRTRQTIEIPYTNLPVVGFTEEDNGLFTKNTLSIIRWSSIRII